MSEYLIPTVVKIGGSVVSEQASVLNSIAFLHQRVPLVIVHGGGPDIDTALKDQGINPKKVDGLRVTDKDTLEVVVSTLNRINHKLTTSLQNMGVNTYGYTSDSGLLQAVIENPKLGFVGSISSVKSGCLAMDLSEGVIPVITPIASMQENEGQYLNINGDTAAGAIAKYLGANLLLVTDVPGVMDSSGSIISNLTKDLYQQMITEGSVTAGMIPKLEAGFQVANFLRKVAICQAEDLSHFFTDKSKGTFIEV